MAKVTTNLTSNGHNLVSMDDRYQWSDLEVLLKDPHAWAKRNLGLTLADRCTVIIDPPDMELARAMRKQSPNPGLVAYGIEGTGFLYVIGLPEAAVAHVNMLGESGAADTRDDIDITLVEAGGVSLFHQHMKLDGDSTVSAPGKRMGLPEFTRKLASNANWLAGYVAANERKVKFRDKDGQPINVKKFTVKMAGAKQRKILYEADRAKQQIAGAEGCAIGSGSYKVLASGKLVVTLDTFNLKLY